LEATYRILIIQKRNAKTRGALELTVKNREKTPENTSTPKEKL